jgi:hypothetical protein
LRRFALAAAPCDFFFGSGTAAGAVADIVKVPKCGSLDITVCHIWKGKRTCFLYRPLYCHSRKSKVWTPVHAPSRAYSRGFAPCRSGCAITPPTTNRRKRSGWRPRSKKTPSGCPPFGEMQYPSYLGVVRMGGRFCGPAPCRSQNQRNLLSLSDLMAGSRPIIIGAPPSPLEKHCGVGNPSAMDGACWFVSKLPLIPQGPSAFYRATKSPAGSTEDIRCDVYLMCRRPVLDVA